MSGRFTRLSILGTSRNADIVIPSDVPIDMVMTQVVQVLGEDPRRTYILGTTTGTGLTSSRSLRELGVEDGVILQLTAADQAPPSPTVFDISESAERVLEDQPARWFGATRRIGLAILAAAALFLAGAAMWLRLTPDLREWAYLAGVVGFVVLGSGMYHLRLREAGAVFSTAGAILGAALLPFGGVLSPGLPVPWLIGILLPLVAKAATTTRPIPWLYGIGAFGSVLALHYVVDMLTGSTLHTAALVGTICLLLIGIMPQTALGMAGVFSAQRRTDQISRSTADTLVARAHGILATISTVLALTAAVAAWVLVLDPSANIWSWSLAGAFGLGAALRQRAFPLASEKMSLWAVTLAAATAATLRLFVAADTFGYLGIAALAVLAVGLLIVAHANVPEHTQAQLRQWGNHLESLALVATVPLVVGMFGVYADLLRILD